MNVRPVEPGSVAEEQKVAALMANVERLVAERRDADAQRLWREAQAILPNHPLVLHERARRFLVGGDPAAACTLLEQLVALAPQQLPFWLSLAAALRSLARREEELQACLLYTSSGCKNSVRMPRSARHRAVVFSPSISNERTDL